MGFGDRAQQRIKVREPGDCTWKPFVSCLMVTVSGSANLAPLQTQLGSSLSASSSPSLLIPSFTPCSNSSPSTTQLKSARKRDRQLFPRK